MKTKLYKSYTASAKKAATESVFVGGGDLQAFAHRADLYDFGDSTVSERTFEWVPSTRTLRIFRLRNGDIGFRSFGLGVGDEGIAGRVFDNEADALNHLNSIAAGYLCDKGWKEV